MSFLAKRLIRQSDNVRLRRGARTGEAQRFIVHNFQYAVFEKLLPLRNQVFMTCRRVSPVGQTACEHDEAILGKFTGFSKTTPDI
ncbi:MAG: hypothetical protein O2960_13625 [Verrucomicrobia bacterium]|nr:hypothetical protein [Verrucomicrobiota bacterium]